MNDSDEESKKKSSAGMLVRFLGICLTIVCCYFVGRAFVGQLDVVRPHLASMGFWAPLLGGSILWVFLNVSLGCAWSRILVVVGGVIPVRESIRITLRTQVAKYLPGNVFHFAGRVVFASHSGVPAKLATATTGIEAMLLVGVALLLSLRLLATLPYFTWGLGFGAGALIVLACLLRGRWIGFYSRLELGLSDVFKGLLMATFWVLAVFVLQAGIFVWIEATLYPGEAIPLVERLELVSASWAAGFLVIGSPGGLGVREYVISILANADSLEARFITVAALTRICSIIGDLLSLVLGLAMKVTNQKNNG